MTPSKPYVVRAIYDWIVDNNCTPHVLIDAAADGVVVPEDYVTDGQIVLNVSPTAVVSLHLGNNAVSFSGRFGGVPLDVFLPLDSILGIYARENGQGSQEGVSDKLSLSASAVFVILPSSWRIESI